MDKRYPVLRYNDSMWGDSKNGVLAVECNSLEEFENKIKQYNKYAYYWRGQSFEKPLLPTIYRGINAPDNKSIKELLNHFRKYMPDAGVLEEFISRAKREEYFGELLSDYRVMICGDDPKENYEEDFITDIYWAIGQHHGLKTPLLDWTRDPYKALFFAFCERKEVNDKRVVFGLAEKNRRLLEKVSQPKRYIEFLDNLSLVERILSSFDSSDSIKERFDQMFKRINAQDGLFTRTLYN